MLVNLDNPTDVAVAAAQVLKLHPHAVIATADASGQPWAVPVGQVTLADGRITWISDLTTRHSVNIQVNAKTSATFYEVANVQGEVSLYLEGTAEVVEDTAQLQEVLSLRSAATSKPAPPPVGLLGESTYRVYAFTPTAIWFNDNSHIKTEVDMTLMLNEFTKAN